MYWKHSEFLDHSTADEYLDIFKYHVEWINDDPISNCRFVHKWTPSLSSNIIDKIINNLIDKLKDECHITNCYCVIFNNYFNGNDYCPYYKNICETDVYTVSLGTSRDMLIKKNERGQRSDKILLESGDLYYMSEEMNKHYKHSIPKRKNVKDTRISIVFFCNTSEDETLHPPICDCWNCEEERKENNS
jgi:hypothetical protein